MTNAESNMQIASLSVEQTIDFSSALIQKVYSPDVCLIFLLKGELGVGKTHFIKGIAEGLQINSPIVSPSYTYVREYGFSAEDGTKLLVHVDAWRATEETTLERMGLASYFVPGNVIAIEWPDNLGSVSDLQDFARQRTDSIEIWSIEIIEDEDLRHIAAERVVQRDF